MPDFVIKTQFRGADKLSPVLKKLGIRVKQVGNNAERSFRRASKQAKVFGGVVKGILAAGLVQRGFGLASQAVRGLGQEFLDFDRNITKAVTRLPGGLDRNSQAFKDFGRIARDEAARTEFTAGQTAEAVELLALAGFNLEQSMAALPGTINLATNAGVEVAEATTIASKTLGAFGLKTKDTAQLTKNLTRVNDVFSKTVSSATLDIGGLFETLKFGGPAAFAAGQSIETFSTLTGVLADSSIDASIAGTSMRRMFIELTKRAKQVKLKKLGVEVKDSAGNFRDFLDILKDVEAGTKDMASVQRLATLEQIFGARAVGAISVLLNKGNKGLTDFRDNLLDSAGASEKMANTIRESVEVRLLRLQSALIETGFKFIEAFSDNAGKGIDDAIEAVRKWDVKPVVQGLKDVISFSKELFNTLKPYGQFVPTLIAMFVAYKAALVAISIVQAAAFFVKLAGAIKITTGAMGALNVVMVANPVGLVTIAIIGLVGALVILITKYDDVVSGWEEVFTNMEIIARKAWIAIKEGAAVFVNGILEVISALPKAFGNLLGIDVSALNLPRVNFVDDEDLKGLKEAENRLKSLKEEAAGLGVARGAAGIRGPRGPRAGAAAAAARAPLSERQFAIGQGRQIANQAVEQLFQGELQAPNRSEVEAQRVFFEGRMSFENAPAGAKFESKTTGGRPISTEGLGAQ